MFLETYNEPVKYELQSPQPFFKRIGGLTVFKRTENNCLRSLLIALFSLLINQGTVRADDNVQNAPSASMNERVLSVPGDPERPAILQVTVLTPDGAGPFPLLVMNHGAAGKSKPAKMPRFRFTFSAYYFLSRGYAVALPMMRGFSESEGKQEATGCNQEELGIKNAKDIRAVIDFMSTQAYVDGNHVIVAGQSFGGWNTLAFGTLKTHGVKGLINFHGGLHIENCPSTLTALASGAEHFGSGTSIPSLWFYGDNDTIFVPPIWHAMYEKYTLAGGRAELVAYGKFMNDSHQLLSYGEGLRIWGPKVDAFLKSVGLPSKITHPEYLPMDFPPPTHFAEIDNVDAVPYLNEEGRKDYKKFLSITSLPKAFVIARDGAWWATALGKDPQSRAMESCKSAHKGCQLYAVDDEVVWSANMH